MNRMYMRTAYAQGVIGRGTFHSNVKHDLIGFQVSPRVPAPQLSA